MGIFISKENKQTQTDCIMISNTETQTNDTIFINDHFVHRIQKARRKTE